MNISDKKLLLLDLDTIRIVEQHSFLIIKVSNNTLKQRVIPEILRFIHQQNKKIERHFP